MSATWMNPTFDTYDLRRVFSSFVTGVTVVTTVDHTGEPFGLTANSFTSVSIAPPLVLWCQSQSAASHSIFQSCERFAINILAEDQVDVSKRFSTKGVNRFEKTPYVKGLGEVPLLEGCVAHIECTSAGTFPAGDHSVFLGRIERIGRLRGKPLMFGRGRYLRPQPQEAALNDFAHDAALLHAFAVTFPEISSLSKRLNVAIAVCAWGRNGPVLAHWAQGQLPPGGRAHSGMQVPITTSATGLVFAAYLSEAVTSDTVDSEMQRVGAVNESDGTVARITFKKGLDEIRRRGLARVVDSDDFFSVYGCDVSALAAPIFDKDERLALVITVVGESQATDLAWNGLIASELQQCATALSKALGHRPRCDALA